MPALKGQRHEAFAQLAVRGAAEGLTQAQINATAREHGRRAECPKEPKAAVRYRRYRKKQYGKAGPASKVRLVDVGNAGDEGRREGS